MTSHFSRCRGICGRGYTREGYDVNVSFLCAQPRSEAVASQTVAVGAEKAEPLRVAVQSTRKRASRRLNGYSCIMPGKMRRLYRVTSHLGGLLYSQRQVIPSAHEATGHIHHQLVGLQSHLPEPQVLLRSAVLEVMERHQPGVR